MPQLPGLPPPGFASAGAVPQGLPGLPPPGFASQSSAQPSILSFSDLLNPGVAGAKIADSLYNNPWETLKQVTGLVDNAGQGATLGFGDEGAAALLSTLGKGQQALGFEPSFTYDSALKTIRNDTKQYQTEHPAAAVLAQMAGGAKLPVGLYQKGTGTLAKGALLAGEGAGYGGAFGFGSGEGGLDNRLTSAGEGAQTGAIAAPAIVGTMSAGRGLLNAPVKAYRALSPASQQTQAEEAARMVVREMTTDPGAAAQALAKLNATPRKGFDVFKNTAEISKDPGIAKLEEAMRRIDAALS